ncbi:hypothetical protein HDU93_009078 [Gonapodya sp. JEL0774]|nr:hypothetical protein HDU93_009078 [Gonapodya sp. JEL0774]
MDTHLIDAVDQGDAAIVRQMIAGGGNPNARKTVTLSCNVLVARKSRGKIKVKKGMFRQEEEERFEEVREQWVDSTLGETALALAIISGNQEVAEVLLEAGADPNLPVEWKNADTATSWNKERWEKSRWVRTYLVDSHLLLAIGRGARVIDYDGSPSTFTQLAEMGKLRVNFKGGSVTVENPTTWKEAYAEAMVGNRPNIVALLLQYGARVTEDAIRLAASLETPVISDMLRGLPVTQIPTPVSMVSSASSPFSALREPTISSPPTPPQRQAGYALGRRPTLPENDLNVSSVALSTTSSRDTLADNSSVNRQGIRTASNEDYQREIRKLTTRGNEFQFRAQSLETRVAELQDRNFALQERNNELERQVAELREKLGLEPVMPQVPETQGPTEIKQLLRVISDFVARAPDEISMSTGQEVFCNLAFTDGWGSVSFGVLSRFASVH